MRVRRLGVWALCGLVLAASVAVADVKLPALIGDNMVLQRGIKASIWGTADKGEQVTVAIGNQKVTATPDAEGRWAVKLEPMEAGGPFELTLAGKNTITLKNVLVGDVWVCSGQSNMQMNLGGCANAKEEADKADYPKVRLFSVKLSVAEQPQTETQGNWTECGPKSVPGFSGVGYFFGRELHKALDVPIGLIHSSWGGTPAESWTTRPTLESDPDYKNILDHWADAAAKYPEAKKKYDEQMAEWKQAADKAKAEKKPAPQQPRAPGDPTKNAWMPAGLYNANIHPLTPFAIKGAIWYQGESNADRAKQYQKLFPAMINDWRKAWGQADLAFFFVQLANFMGVDKEPADSGWAELREAQTMTLALPNTGQAVIIDIGEARDIHPRNKQDVGKRLALAALKVTYGKDIVYSGPTYDSMAVEGSKVRVKFKSIGGGLVAQPLEDQTPNGPTLAKRFNVPDLAELRPKSDVYGFAIAGEDKKFVWAEGKIDGETVVVWSDKVPKPVAIRYAWGNNPVCNLYNKDGLPASPFRTDTWERQAPAPPRK